MRLPDDVAQRIEAKAKDEQRPANRVLINELAEYPTLKEGGGKLAETVRDLEIVLARYSARITTVDLTDDLLKTVDAVIDSHGSAREFHRNGTR